MAPSSSASKVAKLAQKGKGKKVRFQGGTLFPLAIVGVLVLFLPLIVYARQSRPGAGEGHPTTNDHWHAAYGFYVCDQFGLKTLPDLSGTLEETDPATGQLASTRFRTTGVHSHGDGVMHWHPYTGKATGTNAKLKVFLDNYGVKLTNSKLTMPGSQGGEVFDEDKTVCKIDGKEKKASLKVWVWDNYTDASGPPTNTYTTNMTDVRIRNDGMVFMIAFVPDDTPTKAPESAFNLKQLGAADGSGPVTPDTADTTPTSDSTAGTGSTPGTGSTTGTSTPSTGSTAGTATGEPSATTDATATTEASATTSS